MEIPEAPEGISKLIKHCWDQNASTRWTMTDVIHFLFFFLNLFII